jgi:thioredoxin 1
MVGHARKRLEHGVDRSEREQRLSPPRFKDQTLEVERTFMPDTVTEDTFDKEVLESDKPVLVDFWAEWCGPCHAIAPVLDQIAQERDELKVVKLNIDEQPAIAQRYGVMSIPTLILFKEGEPQAAAVGAMPKSMLEERLGLAEAAA